MRVEFLINCSMSLNSKWHPVRFVPWLFYQHPGRINQCPIIGILCIDVQSYNAQCHVQHTFCWHPMRNISWYHTLNIAGHGKLVTRGTVQRAGHVWPYTRPSPPDTMNYSMLRIELIHTERNPYGVSSYQTWFYHRSGRPEGSIRCMWNLFRKIIIIIINL